MFNQFKRLIIGQPKKNRELKDEKISKFKGLAILSSDALSSVAYGPEQILITLSVVGAVATWYTFTDCRCCSDLISCFNYVL